MLGFDPGDTRLTPGGLSFALRPGTSCEKELTVPGKALESIEYKL